MIHIITIVLDGMPFIPIHLPELNKLSLDWRWNVIEGTAKPVLDTAWCKPIAPRLSKDGTTEYLLSIASHPRVKLYRNPQWEGKLEMVNAPVADIKEGDTVIQIDSDEFWTARQIEVIHRLLNMGDGRNMMQFYCRYFVGPNLILTGDDCYGNKAGEWVRAWKAPKKFRFTKHEPPEVNFVTVPIGKKETQSLGLVFDHYAYATEQQVEFKRIYYGYKDAVTQWKALQANTTWPVKLRDYCKWVTDDAMATRLYEH